MTGSRKYQFHILVKKLVKPVLPFLYFALSMTCSTMIYFLLRASISKFDSKQIITMNKNLMEAYIKAANLWRSDYHATHCPDYFRGCNRQPYRGHVSHLDSGHQLTGKTAEWRKQ